jgi:hypothetical protein
MKQAELFVEALKQGLSPIEALRSLPEYEQPYVNKVPVEIYRAALRNGWQPLPVSPSRRLIGTHANFFAATDNPQRLRRSVALCPNWVLLTGRNPGIFVLEVDGEHGHTSLLALCQDDWNWLDTLRSMAGEKRYIFFAWPEGRRQFSGSRQIGEGLSVRGEGDWVLLPPCRARHGAQHSYLNPMDEVVAPPLWILRRGFEPSDAADPSRPFLPYSPLRAALSNAMAESAHD